MRWILVWLALAGLAQAEGERAGEFDYYVLALTWEPNWCARDGRGREACETVQGWTLHGLWPQYERGWPSYCPVLRRNPSRRATAAQSDLFGDGGSAWHQWNKHGRCTGLSAADYYDLSRLAYEGVAMPEVLRALDRSVRLPASVIEEAFLEANPDLDADGVTVTCKGNDVGEVRICLDRTLQPRTCGADVIRDCRSREALLRPIP